MNNHKILVILLSALLVSIYFRSNYKYGVKMNERKAEHKILDLILNRWSPRAMTGEKMPQETLNQLFEAARWAPSSYNAQPWRFIYAHKDTEAWHKLYNLQVDFNKQWSKNSSVLVLVLSYKLFDFNKTFNLNHSFDTGSAVENLCLQAYSMNLAVHGMAGFDYEKAREVFNIPQDYNIEAMYAISYPADPKVLPKELQDKEVISQRKSIDKFIFENEFKADQHAQ
jgi:nitroreductase